LTRVNDFRFPTEVEGGRGGRTPRSSERFAPDAGNPLSERGQNGEPVSLKQLKKQLLDRNTCAMSHERRSTHAAPDISVLLIDDDIELCESMEEFLAARGIRVEATHDGRRGLAKVFAGDDDLILLDVVLRGLDGFEVLRQVRRRSDVPIIMLTGWPSQEDRVAGPIRGPATAWPSRSTPRSWPRASEPYFGGWIDSVLGCVTAKEVNRVRQSPATRQAWCDGIPLELRLAMASAAIPLYQGRTTPRHAKPYLVLTSICRLARNGQSAAHFRVLLVLHPSSFIHSPIEYTGRADLGSFRQWPVRQPMLGASETPYDLRFRFLGIPVRIHPLFWLVAVVLGWKDHDLPAVALWVACVFVSILVHEYGHALMAKAFDYSPSIVLWGLGGLCYSEGERQSPGRRLAVVLAGPGAGFLLAGLVIVLTAVVFRLTPTEELDGLLKGGAGTDFLFQACGNLIWINVVWGLVNLLPMWPLDGGQATQVLLSLVDRARGQRWCHIVSLLVSGALAIVVITKTNDMFLSIFFASFAIINFQILHSIHQAQSMGLYQEDEWWRR
jgi:CheY-like chemotaxis protein/Zn-dependent protease